MQATAVTNKTMAAITQEEWTKFTQSLGRAGFTQKGGRGYYRSSYGLYKTVGATIIAVYRNDTETHDFWTFPEELSEFKNLNDYQLVVLALDPTNTLTITDVAKTMYLSDVNVRRYEIILAESVNSLINAANTWLTENGVTITA